jgi:thioredoxin-related protein
MNNMIIIAVVALLVLVGSTVFLLSKDSDKNSVNISGNNISSVEPAETTPTDSTEMNNQDVVNEVASAGQYIDYSEQSLASSANDKRILFFHAPWCSVCNFYEGQIEDKGVPSDVTIIKIDYDSEDELKERYSVTTQSTFVLLDEAGNIEKSWPFAQGLTSIQDLYNQI